MHRPERPLPVVPPLNWAQVSAFGDEVELDLEDQVDALAALGIESLELRSAWGTPVDKLSSADVRRAKAALAEAGMAVSAVGSPVGKSPITEPFEASSEQLRRCLDVASELGAGLVRVFSFYVPHGELAAARGEVMARMAVLAQLANDAGLVLVHENERGIYGETAESCLDLIESVGSPALRLCFDPANFVQAGVPSLPAWRLLRDHVVHVHVKDASAADGAVRVAGAGDGAWPAILADLAARGYAGYLTLEPHLHRVVEGDGRERLRAAAQGLRGLLSHTMVG